MAQIRRATSEDISYVTCKTYIPVSNIIFTWVIENVNLCRTDVDKPFESPEFHQWKLRLYPNGKNNSDFIGLFLVSYAERERVAKYKMYIQNKKNEQTNECSNTEIFGPYYGFPHERGFSKFMYKSYFFSESSDLQSNGSLRICCEVEEAGKRTDIVSSSNYELKLSKFSEEIYDIFKSSRFTDVTIVAEEKEFKAHKVILSARSPVFAAMFEHEMAEKTSNIIQINDSSSEIIETVLRYIYSGSCDVAKDKAVEVLPVAEKYNLLELKNLCEQTLMSNLDLNNFNLYLILSDMYNLDTLKAATMEFFILKEKELMRTSEWQGMVESHPELVTQLFNRKMGSDFCIQLIPKKTV